MESLISCANLFKNDPLDKPEPLLFNKLNYKVWQELVEYMEKNWKTWEFPARELTQSNNNSALTPKQFVMDICAKSETIKVKKIKKIARTIQDANVELCLKNCVDLHRLRHEANQNQAMGLMQDMSENDLADISKLICDHHQVSCLHLVENLGIPLGLYKTPLHILQTWIKKEPNATVARLHVEAKLLRMTHVCAYLEPLKEVSSLSLFSLFNKIINITYNFFKGLIKGLQTIL
jgi:hypothetical protein